MKEVFKGIPSKDVVILLPSLILVKITEGVEASKKVLKDIKRISWMVE